MDFLFIYVAQRVCSMLEYAGFLELSSNSCMKAGGLLGLGHSIFFGAVAVLIALFLLISLRRRRHS